MREYKKLVDGVQVALERVHVRPDTLEATILMDTEAPTEAENEVVPID